MFDCEVSINQFLFIFIKMLTQEGLYQKQSNFSILRNFSICLISKIYFIISPVCQLNFSFYSVWIVWKFLFSWTQIMLLLSFDKICRRFNRIFFSFPRLFLSTKTKETLKLFRFKCVSLKFGQAFSNRKSVQY